MVCLIVGLLVGLIVGPILRLSVRPTPCGPSPIRLQ
jgi:hypothetical protein